MKSHKRTYLSVERLEDRTTPSYGLGYAIGLPTAGGSSQVAVDVAGNAIVSSAFSAASLDLGPAIGVLVNAGSSSDQYVAKRDPQGNLLWAVHAAAAGFNSSRDVAVDGAGNVFVAGEFTGSVEIRVPGATSITLTAADNAGSAGFLAKIAPSGELLWARTIGEGERRVAYGITTDAEGNVYATGEIPGSYQMFVTKYSGATGTTVWDQVIKDGTGINYIGWPTYARGADVALDSAGNVYSTGMFMGRIDFNPHPTQTNLLSPSGSTPQTLHLNDDIFVLKMNAAGGHVWAGNMGGTGIDTVSGIRVDGADNVYVNGTLDTIFPSSNDVDPGAGALNLPGGSFIAKLSPNRVLLWGRSGLGETLALDAAGNLHTLTNISGTVDADHGTGTFNVTAAGQYNLLFRRFDSAGRFVWAEVLGGAAFVRSLALAVDQQGNLYSAGVFKGTADLDPSAGAYPLTSTSIGLSGQPTTDTFVVKLVEIEPPPLPLPPPAPALRIGDVSKNEGKSGTTSFTFTVSLSGAFEQPVTVRFGTADRTARAGSDYTAASGVLSFAPGETSKTVTIAVKGDKSKEADETFAVMLSEAVNAWIEDKEGLGTILNDD